MASACVNNVTLPPSYGCLSPRISFNDGSDPTATSNNNTCPDPDSDDFIDFEFHLNDPVGMLTADELFSDGKLVPLHLAPAPVKLSIPDSDLVTDDTRLRSVRKVELIGFGSDPFAVSPKAPTCSIRWRELLRLKRQQQQQKEDAGAGAGAKNPNTNTRSLKHFLNRSSRSSASDLSQTLPLLKESESEPLTISSRLSLSSTSSSGRETDDHPRLSLDSENKPNQNPILLNRNPPRARSSKTRSVHTEGRAPARAGRSPVRRPTAEAAAPPRCASVDSPRMNASGKVVFQGLGRSSSSPSTFNGGPRIRHRGMERSYSANVRVTPVLNVPVCSLRGGSKNGSVFGLGQIFSGPKTVSVNKGKN